MAHWWRCSSAKRVSTCFHHRRRCFQFLMLMKMNSLGELSPCRPWSIDSLCIAEVLHLPNFNATATHSISSQLQHWMQKMQGSQALRWGSRPRGPSENNETFGILHGFENGCFHKMGYPQNGFIMENPIQTDDLGVPLFRKPPNVFNNTGKNDNQGQTTLVCSSMSSHDGKVLTTAWWNSVAVKARRDRSSAFFHGVKSFPVTQRTCNPMLPRHLKLKIDHDRPSQSNNGCYCLFFLGRPKTLV